MATIKSDRVDYEKLLNGIDPVKTTTSILDVPSEAVVPTPSNVASAVDSTTPSETMQVKMFTFDYDSVKKGLRKKARKSIINIVQHIIPADIIEEAYIQDKLEQDIETLTELYMQLELNKIMQRSQVDLVASGNTMPRMYEVFGQMTDKIQSINKQIVDTEQRIRKTYVDLKFEIRDKQSEEFGSIGAAAIENPSGTMITSTRDLIAGARKRHIDKISNANETEFEIQE